MLTASDQEDRSGEIFSVEVDPGRTRVVVKPSGELDLVTASYVEHELSELRVSGFSDIVLDLRGGQ